MGYGGGDTTQVTYANSDSANVSYDAWGRVFKVFQTSNAGGSATVSYTTYQYDALGRQIGSTVSATGTPSGNWQTQFLSPAAGTHTYYDGTNPIEVFTQNNLTLPFIGSNSTLIERFDWSPTTGQMILRDAVASPFNSYAAVAMPGVSITANTANGIQRLYPLYDAQGSVVATVAATIYSSGSYVATTASNMVDEFYVYTADGLPQALQGNWSAYSSDSALPVSGVGWNWLYHNQQYVQPSILTASNQSLGFYVNQAGVWSDPYHDRGLQPKVGDQLPNPYALTNYESTLIVGRTDGRGLRCRAATFGLERGAFIAAWRICWRAQQEATSARRLRISRLEGSF